VKLDPTQILIAPVVSEKSYHMINTRQYCFRVHQDAHKLQVRQAGQASAAAVAVCRTRGVSGLEYGAPASPLGWNTPYPSDPLD